MLGGEGCCDSHHVDIIFTGSVALHGLSSCIKGTTNVPLHLLLVMG